MTRKPYPSDVIDDEWAFIAPKLTLMKELAETVQGITHQSVEVAFGDQGYTGDHPKNDAKEVGIELIVVKLSEPRMGLSFCQDVGSLNVVLPGLPVCVVWHVISKDCLRCSEAFTF